MPDNVGEETQKLDDELTKEAKDGKYPETVSWGQYVGIKESLGKKLDTATQKVGTLEEQLKGAISAEEHNKIKAELETIKTTQQKSADEAKVALDASLKEKRDTLIKKGVAEDKIANMSLEQIDSLLLVAAGITPGADMGGGGGGSGELKGSPMELARQAYGSSNK